MPHTYRPRTVQQLSLLSKKGGILTKICRPGWTLGFVLEADACTELHGSRTGGPKGLRCACSGLAESGRRTEAEAIAGFVRNVERIEHLADDHQLVPFLN